MSSFLSFIFFENRFVYRCFVKSKHEENIQWNSTTTSFFFSNTFWFDIHNVFFKCAARKFSSNLSKHPLHAIVYYLPLFDLINTMCRLCYSNFQPTICSILLFNISFLLATCLWMSIAEKPHQLLILQCFPFFYSFSLFWQNLPKIA